MGDVVFGECPICRQGQLIAVKNAATGALLVMCDDCESQWRSPEEAKFYENASSTEVSVGVASLEEVRAAGWSRYMCEE